ncbi:MAG: shikimate kinase [bacterium]
METTYKYFAVTGKPISHSLSPVLFNQVFDDMAFGAHYTRLLSLTAEDALETAKAIGFSGMNVTSPFKEDMLNILKHVDDEAREIGAVNAINFIGSTPFGTNTDSLGILRTLDSRRVGATNRIVLVLGAGGCAKAVVNTLSKFTKNITILNRTVSKAKALAENYGCAYGGLEDFEKHLPGADFVISTLSQKVDLDFSKVDRLSFFMDFNYNTPQAIDKKHYHTIKGIDWLINQAVESFNKFTWFEPNVMDFIRALDRPKNKTTNISLIGFSGAGKTTFAKALAKKLDMDFMDVDSEIEGYARKSINEIFANESEHTFRNLELDVLGSIKDRENTVIATGGGAVEFGSSRDLLKEHSLVIYLYAPFEDCMKRADVANRPKLRDTEENLLKLFDKRKKLYFMTSDLLIDSRFDFDKTMTALVNDIRS